jgi:tetratricopeptide (TPR) repeat protein
MAVVSAMPASNKINRTGHPLAALEKRLPEVSGKEKFQLLIRIIAIDYKENPRRALRYAEQALVMAEELNDEAGKALLLMYLANIYRGGEGEITQAFNAAREALKIFNRLGNKGGSTDALNTMGYLYRSIGNYDEALKYLVKALEICDQMNFPIKKAGIFYQMGILYGNWENHQREMEYYQKALKIFEEEKILERKTFLLNNIGMAYQNLGQNRRALEFFERAYRMFKKKDSTYGMIAALGNMGTSYGELNDFPRALEYLRQAVDIAKENNIRKGLCDNYFHIGNQYFKIEDYGQARDYFMKALDIARERSDKLIEQNIYEMLSKLYVRSGDHKTGMEYYIKFNEIKDHLINEKKNLQMLELQARYEAERKAMEIENLKKDNKIQRITRNGFIAGFALALVIMAILFKKYLHLFAFWKKEKYLGQYRLIKSVGTGGMSTVYKAHSMRDKNEIVAIKVLKDELSRRESTRKRFKLEGTIIDKLDHPNIIKIFERGQYQGKLFIVMEYLNGRTLAEKIETNGRIIFPEALPLMKQIADALAFIHGSDIIHRDLKPGNIMVTVPNPGSNDETAKLLDFGLSKMRFQTRITMTGVLVGTVSYMAPEQISDLESSPASDVFNLGLIYYEMLTGRVAFTGDTISHIERQILEATPAEPLALLPDLPESVSRLIMEMINKNPGRRPTAEDVFQRLDYM